MKMISRRSVLLLATLLALAPMCPAQEPTSTQALRTNPLIALKAFEPAADQPYELGRGDEISVEVIGRPELTGKHVIGPDGDITLPIAGSVKVADKTREDAATAIQTALSSYYAGVTVSIGVEKYSSNQVLLLGAVEHPGLMTFDKTPTLLEVISRGGMQLSAPASSTSSGTTTKPVAVPEECMIYRGKQEMITVQLRSLLDQGNALANMRLKRDDIVYIPGQTKYISVLGQVTHPGNLRLDRTSTLPELLAEAGGPTDKSGRNPEIQIIHRGTADGPGKLQKIPYKDLLLPKTLDLSLQSGDIIFVPESGFNGVAYTFEKIAPLVSLFTVGALLR